MQLRPDRLLHPRIGELPLSSWLLRNQPDDTEPHNLLIRWIYHRDDRTVHPWLEFEDRISRGRVCALQPRFRDGPKIASVAGSFRILGISHGQSGKIVPTLQTIRNHLDLLAGIGLVLRLVVLIGG